MKAIVLNAILSSFRSRKDKSMGFSVSTPELAVPEKVSLMELEGLNVRMLIEPSDYEPEGKMDVKKDLHSKSQSERLRAVLFIRFKQDGGTDFDEYYRTSMNLIIDSVKAQLAPQPF